MDLCIESCTGAYLSTDRGLIYALQPRMIARMQTPISKNLSQLMFAKGVNQAELSRRAGVGQSTISRILNPSGPKGILNPSDTQVKKIADYFGVSTDQLRGHSPIDILNDRTEEYLGHLHSGPLDKERASSTIASARTLLENTHLSSDELFGISEEKLSSWHDKGVSRKDRELFDAFEARAEAALRSNQAMLEEYADHIQRSDAIERFWEEKGLPDELETTKTIIQRINAVIEHKCNGNPENLSALAGISDEDVAAVLSRSCDPIELVELAQKLEIGLKLPERALLDPDPTSPPSLSFYRYLVPEINSEDLRVRCVKEAMEGLFELIRAVQDGRIEWDHVYKIQGIVKSLPSASEANNSSWLFPRTKLDKDKTPGPDSGFFWL